MYNIDFSIIPSESEILEFLERETINGIITTDLGRDEIQKHINNINGNNIILRWWYVFNVLGDPSRGLSYY